MKVFVHLAAPLATFIGVVLSAWGTYRLTLYYFPFPRRRMDFWKSILRVSYYVGRLQIARAKRYVYLVARIGRNRTENRVDSLVGLYLLFVGFVFQALGGLFWYVDSMMDVVAGH